MKSALLAFGVATAALPSSADHLVVVKVGGTNFVAKIEDTATGRAFLEKLPLTIHGSRSGNDIKKLGTVPDNVAESALL